MTYMICSQLSEGHDLNYLALSGVLSVCVTYPRIYILQLTARNQMLPGEGKPTFPLNILADFAGGGAMCATGVLLALMERNRSGLGQVVHTDMVSGARYLSSFPLLLSHLHAPTFSDPRGTGLLDGGAPFYNVYTCTDGRWMSVACLEPRFFRVFVKHFVGALPKDFALDDGWRLSEEHHVDTEAWPRMKEFMEKGFMSQPRDYWANVFHGMSTSIC